MGSKASVFQAQGDLPGAAKLLVEVNAQTNSDSFRRKITQLRLERNYAEAIRLLQAHLVQVRFDSPYDKAYYQVTLALTQYLAGDTAGAKVTAEPARNTLEHFHGDQPDNGFRADVVKQLSQAYAAIGKKDSALKAAQQAVMLLPRAKDLVEGPQLEENLALIQTIFGENNRAIATLTQLLQTPYYSWLYGPAPITPALLRLDPLWDPLRSDPAFQKLCEEKQPVTSK